MSSFLDEILASLLLAVRQPVESFIQLETADDATTLVSGDGSLISFIRMLGSRQIIGDAEYRWIVDQATMKLGARFDRPGHAMQVYFVRDPSLVGRDVDKGMRGNRNAAQALDLSLEDLLNERRRHLARFWLMKTSFLFYGPALRP